MYRLIALVASSVLAATAMAGDDKSRTPQGRDSSMTMTFEALDKNGDQQISRTEAQVDKKLAENFAHMDTNRDGYVSKSEFAARTKT